MKSLSTQQFNELLTSGAPFAVDFYAGWCVACAEMLPVMTEIAQEHSVPVYKVNIDDEPELKEKLRIKAIPMVMMFKDGRLRKFSYGKVSKEKIVSKLNRL